MLVGDTLARWVYNNEPTKFAAIELVPKTESDVPETLFGHLNSDGTVSGGIPIPGMASILSDPADRDEHHDPGAGFVPGGRPADDRAGRTPSTSRGTSWSGSGRCSRCSRSGTASRWLFRRDMPKSKLFLWIAAAAGVLSVITMEAGWVVTEVGRQPWIARNYLRVEDAATGNQGVWITFFAVVALYLAVAVVLILVLRSMSRRFRQAELDESDVPYGPRQPPTPA